MWLILNDAVGLTALLVSIFLSVLKIFSFSLLLSHSIVVSDQQNNWTQKDEPPVHNTQTITKTTFKVLYSTILQITKNINTDYVKTNQLDKSTK